MKACLSTLGLYSLTHLLLCTCIQLEAWVPDMLNNNKYIRIRFPNDNCEHLHLACPDCLRKINIKTIFFCVEIMPLQMLILGNQIKFCY